MADGFVPAWFHESAAAVDIAAENMSSNGPVVAGVTLCRGSRVRLRPSQRADIVDLALVGRVAEVERVEEDAEGRVHVVVMLDGDSGRDLGAMSQLGHRFFFAPEELEPLAEVDDRPPSPRVLVAGIGDAFRADGAFGPEVVDRLRRRHLPRGVHVVDFGIREKDLTHALQDGYEVALLLCAVAGEQDPGALSVAEPDVVATGTADGTCGVDPFAALALARRLGTECRRFLVVGCQSVRQSGDRTSNVSAELSGPVRGSLEEAVRLVEGLLDDLLGSEQVRGTEPTFPH